MVATDRLRIPADAASEAGSARRLVLLEAGERVAVVAWKDMKHYLVPEAQLRDGRRGHVLQGEFELQQAGSLSLRRPLSGRALNQAYDVSRTVANFICVGIGMPVTWLSLYHGCEAFAMWWFAAPEWVDILRLLLWPSAIVLMADPADRNAMLWVASALANGLLYGLLGVAYVKALRS